MSASNVILAADHVRLVTDTVSYLDKAPVAFNRKVAIFPAARLAVTVRGFRWIGNVVRAAVEQFDGYAAAVDGITLIMTETVPRLASSHGMHLGRVGYEVTLAGWDGGPAACRLTFYADLGRVDRLDFAPGAAYLAPALGPAPIPADLTDEQIVRIAVLQQQVALKHGLQMCVGGDVEMATVTADGVTIRALGSYPDKEMTAARIARRDEHSLAEIAA